jgi:DNA-binding PadR family transcriptional regulator
MHLYIIVAMTDIPSPIGMQLLSLVEHEERAGREVAKLYEQETGKPIAYGTLYTTFRRLRDAGWVKVRDDEDADGRVRYFQIDIDGRRALSNGRAFYAAIPRFGLPKLREHENV